MRRRIVVALLSITIAAAACLGVRAMASRGDGAASLPTVTPNGSALLMTAVGTDPVLDNGVDLAGAFIRGEQVYVVQPGDTLWSIASSLTDGDIRSFVDELIALNGAASVDVGQQLVLPAD
jgi:Tfp pilus assembly protein FimV